MQHLFGATTSSIQMLFCLCTEGEHRGCFLFSFQIILTVIFYVFVNWTNSTKWSQNENINSFIKILLEIVAQMLLFSFFFNKKWFQIYSCSVSPPQFSTLYIVSFIVITVGFIMFNAVPTYTALPGSNSSEEDPAEDPTHLVAESILDQTECQPWHRKKKCSSVSEEHFFFFFRLQMFFFTFFFLQPFVLTVFILFLLFKNGTFVLVFLMTANPISALILG